MIVRNGWGKLKPLFSFKNKILLVFSPRYWRVREVDLHQTDAYYSRCWIHRRGQAYTHQACLPEYIHGYAVYDQSNGLA